jgi:hypothetical protein
MVLLDINVATHLHTNLFYCTQSAIYFERFLLDFCASSLLCIVWNKSIMLTILRNTHIYNRPIQLGSVCSNHQTYRGFTWTTYKNASPSKTHQDHPQDQETIKKAHTRAYTQQYYAERAEALKEKRRKHYQDNKEYVLQHQKEYYLRNKGALRAKSRLEQQAAKQQALKEAIERQTRADRKAKSERRRAEKKTESERQRAQKKSEREKLRAEQRAERQASLARERATLSKERATRRAAEAAATRNLLRQKAAEYRRDPDVRKDLVAQERQRRATDNNYAQRSDMRIWLLRCSQPDAFSWKTHVPMIYPQKVVKTCSACGKTRFAGARLWWKRLGLYECHTCYTADVSRAMPRGFENFVFGNGKNPRP